MDVNKAANKRIQRHLKNYNMIFDDVPFHMVIDALKLSWQFVNDKNKLKRHLLKIF